MGKTTTKRKSTGDLPEKKRPRKTLESEEEGPKSGNSETEHVSNDEDTLFESKARHVKRKKLRHSEPLPPKRRQKSDEYAADDGRAQTQKFLSLVGKTTKMKKQDAKDNPNTKEDFQYKLMEDEEQLKKHIETLTTESRQRDANFIEHFKDAFATSRPKPPPKDSTKAKSRPSGLIFASLYSKSRDMITNGLAIVDKFEEANKQTININVSDLVDKEAWTRQNREVGKILEFGHAAGIEKYQKLLSTEKLREEADDDNEGVKTFYPSSSETHIPGWGVVAKRVEKGAKKLVKALPLQTSLREL